MTDQKMALLSQKSTLIARLLSRIAANDFNSVQAIAGDIREVDAKLSMLSVVESTSEAASSEISGWDTRLG